MGRSGVAVDICWLCLSACEVEKLNDIIHEINQSANILWIDFFVVSLQVVKFRLY